MRAIDNHDGTMRVDLAPDETITAMLPGGGETVIAVGPVTMSVVAQPGLLVWDEILRRGIGIEPAPATVPASISDRQFAHGLWRQDVISLDEARAFVKLGELPPALSDIVGALPAEMRDDVDLMLSGATVFERSHPAVDMIAMAFGWTDEVLDEFWRFAATL